MNEYIREGIRLKENNIENPRVEYLIRFTNYSGLEGVDIRRFVMGGATRKGVVLPVKQWADFYQKIRRFNKMIEKHSRYLALTGGNNGNGHKSESNTFKMPSVLVSKPVNQIDSKRNNVRDTVNSIFLEE